MRVYLCLKQKHMLTVTMKNFSIHDDDDDEIEQLLIIFLSCD